MILAAHVGSAGVVAADWPPDGVPLCTMCDMPGPPHVAPDGVGGAFVVWGDAWSGNRDVHAQRVTASGEIAPGWPAASGGGLAVCSDPLPQFVNDITPDGSVGVLIVWFDYRDVLAGTTGIDIYAQRILADGSVAPGWAVGGMPVTRAAGDQVRPVLLADGSGGAFVSWHDDASQDIYLQRSDGPAAAAGPRPSLQRMDHREREPPVPAAHRRSAGMASGVNAKQPPSESSSACAASIPLSTRWIASPPGNRRGAGRGNGGQSRRAMRTLIAHVSPTSQ